MKQIDRYILEKLHLNKNSKYTPKTNEEKIEYIQNLAEEKGLEVKFRNKTTNAGDFAFFIYDKSALSSYLIAYDGSWDDKDDFDNCYEQTIKYIENYKK